MKSCIVLILLIVISTCNCSTTVYKEGRSGGPLLFKGNRLSVAAWEGSWQARKVRYPTDGEYAAPIRYIKIDNMLDSDYSTAIVKEGGVGSNFVVIEYYAPAFRGYDYTVEIRD